MKNRLNGVFVLLILMLSVLIWSGCSKQSTPSGKAESKALPQSSGSDVSKAQIQPSDEEIIKAIDDSGLMKRADGSIAIVPPVMVVEKSPRNKSGSWPVKVKFTLQYKMKDGKFSQPSETTSSFGIFEEKDDLGKFVWKARLGS